MSRSAYDQARPSGRTRRTLASLRNVPVAEIDELEMPFELMPPSFASVVRSHLSEGLPTERPETWARAEASDDGQNGGELGRRAPTSLSPSLPLWTALSGLLITARHFRSNLSAQMLRASGSGFDRDLSGSRQAWGSRVTRPGVHFQARFCLAWEGFAKSWLLAIRLDSNVVCGRTNSGVDRWSIHLHVSTLLLLPYPFHHSLSVRRADHSPADTGLFSCAALTRR
eukprot:COSAG02_NODE_54_length_43941_cov_54.857990_34_plen_226_part_00